MRPRVCCCAAFPCYFFILLLTQPQTTTVQAGRLPTAIVAFLRANIYTHTSIFKKRDTHTDSLSHQKRLDCEKLNLRQSSSKVTSKSKNNRDRVEEDPSNNNKKGRGRRRRRNYISIYDEKKKVKNIS